MTETSKDGHANHSKYLTACEVFCDFLQPHVKRIADFSPEPTLTGGDFVWELTRRSAVVRQYEVFTTIIQMVRLNCGHHAVSFLRAAFEELIWLRYLKMHVNEAKEFLGWLTIHEANEHIVAQQEFAGASAMREMGFSRALIKESIAKNSRAQEKIREIGEKLGWDMSRGLLPSSYFIARQVGADKDYRFLFQGTSRFVHFSISELLRRAWYGPKGVRIGSYTFSHYWEQTV